MQETEKLRRLKEHDQVVSREDGEAGYYLWDQPYYNRLMLETSYNVDQEKFLSTSHYR